MHNRLVAATQRMPLRKKTARQQQTSADSAAMISALQCSPSSFPPPGPVRHR